MPITVARHSELIPGYRLLERLGEGGFGEVWKAEAPGGLLKAVKIISANLSGGETNERRLNQELKALHRVRTIRHPFVLSLERFEIVDGRLVIVMELADKSLWDRFQECRAKNLPGIPRDELLRYFEEAAEALDLMNEQYNLQHLDIKPQNLFLLFNHIKVGDFGLVKDLEGMWARATSGVTAVYAAPEAFEGLVSRYCDQYNLAVAYQELLTGQLPFHGNSSRQFMLQHVMGVPDLRPLPEADRPAVGRALAKKPEERHPSCMAFVQALRRGGGTAVVEPAAAVAVPAPPAPAPVEVVADEPDRTTPPTQFLRPARREAAVIDRRDTEEFVEAVARSGTPDRSSPGSTPGRAASTSAPRFAEVVPPPPPERPETTGDGVLFPALVVGLGGLGGQVLRQVRETLRKKGPTETWPHIRLLHLDTDPATLDQLTGGPDAVLTPDQMVLTRFFRPAQYLKRQKERRELEEWLSLTALARLPREQVTASGCRPLGRLAYVSNHVGINARLRAELEACTAPNALAAADRRTGLGLRTTHPRVYVVTSLVGGTGSGMFIDLAYTLRRTLRQLGYPRAEVVGLLLVPTVERGRESARAVANAFAALAELRHFAAPGVTYRGSYPDAEDRHAPPAAPFSRCVLLQLPATADGAAALRELTAQAGDFVCRGLTTALGRAADEGRAALQLPEERLPCHTFGTYSFSVPRRPLLQRVAHSLCDRLVHGWQVATPAALDELIQSWITGQMTRWELSPEYLIRGLEEGGAAGLCDEWVQRWAKGGAEELSVRPSAGKQAVSDLEELVGPPRRSADGETPCRLAQAVEETLAAVAEEAEKRVAEVALGALVEPRFRLIGAEEEVQGRLDAALGDAARQHAAQGEERRQDAEEIRERMEPVLEVLQKGSFLRWGRKSRAAVEMVELLRAYAAASREAVLLRAVARLYQDLQTNLRKYLLAVDCCRPRLRQFVDSFADVSGRDAVPVDLGLGRYLLPGAARTLGEAVGRVLDSLTPEDEQALQDRVQALIGDALQAHLHLCTAPPAHFFDLKEAIAREVAAVAESSLGKAHAAELYVEQHAADPEVSADLAGAFDEARPELAPPRHGGAEELCILAVPPGREGEHFRSLVESALPDTPMRLAGSADDVVFYRELPRLPLDELPQLGPAAREVYEQVLASEPLGPHSRGDIPAWRAAQAAAR
jgi:serine/threonine protein kinase